MSKLESTETFVSALQGTYLFTLNIALNQNSFGLWDTFHIDQLKIDE